jgi:hypothetical protein
MLYFGVILSILYYKNTSSKYQLSQSKDLPTSKNIQNTAFNYKFYHN